MSTPKAPAIDYRAVAAEALASGPVVTLDAFGKPFDAFQMRVEVCGEPIYSFVDTGLLDTLSHEEKIDLLAAELVTHVVATARAGEAA